MTKRTMIGVALVLGSIGVPPGPRTAHAGEDAAIAAREKLLRIEISQRTAEAQFDLAMQFLRECEDEDRREPERRDSDPDYMPIGSSTRLLGKLTMLNHKHDALRRIGQALDAKIEVARVLPAGEQLRMVEEDLQKAEQRSKADPGASTLAHVLTLLNARSRLRIELQRGGRRNP